MTPNETAPDKLIRDLADAYRRLAELEALGQKQEQREQALLHERYLLRTLIDNLPDPIYFKDLESRFVVGNLAVARIMGATTPAEIVGKTDFEFFPPELAEAYYADEQEVMRSGTALINREEPLINLTTGEKRWLATTKVALRDRTGHIMGVVGIGRDITERKRVEEALRQSRRQVLNILESITDAFCALDKEWRFTYVNQRAEQLIQRKRTDLLDKVIWDEFPDSVSLKFYEEYHRAVEEQVTVEFVEFYPLLGKWLSVHAYPYPGGLSIYFQDVTERRESEQELARYRDHLEELVEERTAELIQANQQLQHEIGRRKQAEVRLLQYAERLKILQEIDRSILAAQSREAIAHAALRNIRRLAPCRLAQVAEFDFNRREAIILATHVNNEIRIEVVRLPLSHFGLEDEPAWKTIQVVEDLYTLRPRPPAADLFIEEGVNAYINVPLLAADELIGVLTLASGRPAAFGPEHIAIAQEVATQLAVAIQQARLHEQVQRYAVELEQRVTERTSELQEIIAELESFSYSVSHDLRAPLRAMQGFADALLEDYGSQLDDAGQDYSRRIAAAAQRMDTLIQDLLTYGRLSRTHLRPQPVSLEAVITDALSQLEHDFQERQVELLVDRPLPHVLGHQATLVQVLVNLLANAIKFVAPEMRPRVHIRAEIRQARVRLWIADNGIGVAPEHQERIFRVFERLHGFETYPGTGIGLAFVRKGLARMGGQVGLESAPGQGSKFWLELPQAAPEE